MDPDGPETCGSGGSGTLVIIVTYFSIERIVSGHDVEELPPNELIDDGVARLRVALVHLQQRQTD
jgi:hypothetical protein